MCFIETTHITMFDVESLTILQSAIPSEKMLTEDAKNPEANA